MNELVSILIQIGILVGLVWVIFTMPTPGIDKFLDEITSPKIYVTREYIPKMTREDMEKYHPNLMKALDNIPQMERDIQKLNRKMEK